MRGVLGVTLGILAVAAVATAVLADAERDPVKVEVKTGRTETPVSVIITGGSDGMEAVAEFADEGRIALRRSGAELEFTLEGLPAEHAMNAAEFIVRLYREVYDGTKEAALESSPEWREMRMRCREAEGRIRELEVRTRDMQDERRGMQSRIHELEEQLERRARHIENMEAELEEREEIIEDLSAELEEMEADLRAGDAE